MKSFYFDTETQLKEIFMEHCNLTGEQYEELDSQFLNLLCDYQENEPDTEIEKRINYLKAVIDFLYNTKTTTLKEHNDLENLLENVQKFAKEKALA